jgi:hypothetical protein
MIFTYHPAEIKTYTGSLVGIYGSYGNPGSGICPTGEAAVKGAGGNAGTGIRCCMR